MLEFDRRKCIRSLLFSMPPALILSISFALGGSMQEFGAVDLRSASLWLSIVGLLVLFETVLFILFGFGSEAIALQKGDLSSRSKKTASGIGRFASRFVNGGKKRVFLFAFIIFVCWIPYYLIAFPGLYTYDAVHQTQWAIVQGTVSSFHPLIHTYWLSGLMVFGKAVLGSYEAGVALYSVSQMALVSLGFSWIVCFVAKRFKNALAPILVLTYFALFPLHPLLALSTTKDIVFSVSFVIFVCLVFDLIKSPEMFLKSRLNWFGFVGICFLASAFRNNGLYAVLITLVAVVVMVRVCRKKTTLLVALSMIACLSYSFVFVPAVADSGSTKSEMLGVPIQQLSRLASSDSIDEETRSSIEHYIPSYELYSPAITDPVKFRGDLSNIDGDMVGFLELWLREGVEHPGVYLDAFVALTYGFWDPAADYYDINTTKPYLEYQGWTYYPDGHAERLMAPDGYKEILSVDDPCEWIFIESSNFFPRLSDVLEGICLDPPWTHWGIVSILISPGMLLQYVIIAFCYCLCRTRYNNAFAFAVVLLYFATCLLGPCFLIRYAYPLFVFAPLIPVLCGRDKSRRLPQPSIDCVDVRHL